MERLASISSLVVSQRKEWGEILTGFETKNRYSVSDISGRRLYLAAEEGGSTLLRWFLKALRPFTMTVLTEEGQVILRVIRPFRFYFHRVMEGLSQTHRLVRILKPEQDACYVAAMCSAMNKAVKLLVKN